MEQNPYSLSTSALAEVQHVLPPRPLSIWLVLSILMAIAALCIFAIARYFLFVAPPLLEQPDLTALAIWVFKHLAFAALSLIAMAGIYDRRQWGRWFCIVCLGTAAAFSIFSTKLNHNFFAEVFVHCFLIPFPITWLIYAFAFSKKAKRYFSSK